MFKFLKNLYLLSHSFDVLLLFAFFFNGFYGNKLACESFPSFIDLTISSLPD